MNIKLDPGRAPGFERSVDAEPGPMGAGAGAAAAIDNNEPSPRGAAIEKAQAELRSGESGDWVMGRGGGGWRLWCCRV
jgi:hypothetical protein